jgi:hypothetical protein
MDVACPNCGEGCAGHPLVQVCAYDEEDWPCAVAAAKAAGWREAIEALRTRAVDIAAYDDAYLRAADYLESLAPKVVEPDGDWRDISQFVLPADGGPRVVHLLQPSRDRGAPDVE